MAFGIPPDVAREGVRERLSLHEGEGSTQQRHGDVRIFGAAPLEGQAGGAVHIGGDARADPVMPGPAPRGEEGGTRGVGPHGSPRCRSDVEQGLRSCIGIGGAEHPRTEPVTRDLVARMQGQIGHEFDGTPHPVRR